MNFFNARLAVIFYIVALSIAAAAFYACSSSDDDDDNDEDSAKDASSGDDDDNNDDNDDNDDAVGCASAGCSVDGTVCNEDDDICHCGSKDGPVCDDGAPCDGGNAVCLPASVCTAGTKWASGISSFKEVTAEWGLEDIAAQGLRINSVDFNGDGRPDIIVRFHGVYEDNLADGSARHFWVLKNVGGEKFEDVTEASGLLATRGEHDPVVTRPGEVYAFGDVNNDGFLDAYSGCYTGDTAKTLGETSEILLSNGDGTFSLTDESNPVRRSDAIDFPGGASFIDYDLDGNLDLWLPQHNHTASDGAAEFMQSRLFKGDGTGNFTDVTEEAGLTTEGWFDMDTISEGRAHARAWSAVACDLNNDGLPELMTASYGRAPNHLWQAKKGDGGGVEFINRSVASGYAYDEDFSWQDNQFARCYCRDNPDAEDCGDVPAPQIQCQSNWNHFLDREPGRLGGNSGATICADINNDGAMDLLTTEIHHWWAGDGSDHSEILVNTGENDVELMRIGSDWTGIEFKHDMTFGGWDEGHMTANVFDFDNDARPDVYIGASDYAGNRGLLFHQEPGLTFTELETADFFEQNRSHGIAVADFDGDGDLDVMVGHSRARCDANLPNNCYETQQVRLFENILGQDGNWVQLTLEGADGANRSAIGARISVTSGKTTQTQEVGGGYGHFGAQDDLLRHFGLGSACEALVTIRWPDAELTTQTFKVSSGYRYKVVQGELPEVQ